MSRVDAGLKFKSVLILVDFPDFDNAFWLATDGVLDTSSTSEKVAFQSKNFSIAVQTWMLFLCHEYIFV